MWGVHQYREDSVYKCAPLYHASPQRWPTASGCWVSESDEFRTLVWRQLGPHRRSVTPGTECTEYVEEICIAIIYVVMHKNCVNCPMASLITEKIKISPWSKTPHRERRQLGSAQRGCAPCGHLAQLQQPLISPQIGLWPLTPLLLPHLHLKKNRHYHWRFTFFQNKA